MISAILYIGISQSIFAAILFFLKRPLSIADKILGVWLIAISCMFILNVIKQSFNVYDDTWPISVNLTLTFPQFLYLYSKYITKEYNRFSVSDFWHFSPSIIGITTIAIFYNPEITDLNSFAQHYSNLLMPRRITGHLFVVCLWVYTIGALINILRYRKQIGNFYSFQSKKISLDWLIVVVISFFSLYHVIIISTSFHVKIEYLNNIELFRSGALLLFVYILSFWGLKQQQLIFQHKSVQLNQGTEFQKSNSVSYKKSGLKDKQAEIYLQKLIDYMNHSEAWKDPELSVAKLSEETDTPKHYVTQVLNEHLQKNFYTFVNEYRTENAKKLILSQEYENWSFIAVAYECGFNSKTAFNNFFKKHTNMTPTEFKNSEMPIEE